MIAVQIKGTSSLSPGHAVHTEEIAERMNSTRTAEQLRERTGISTRYHGEHVKGDVTRLGVQALSEALERAEIDVQSLARLIFVSSHGGDYLIPATSTRILGELGLSEAADAFDINNACMGFLSAFDLAARTVATGTHPVGIVVVELLSTYLTPEDPRPYAVLGDGVAAAIVDRPREDGPGVLGTSLRTLPAVTGAYLDHPGVSSRKETIQFSSTNSKLGELALKGVVDRTREALEMAERSIDDIDWFVPHQPNGRMFEAFIQAVGVPEEKTVRIVDTIGSVGAASIPMSLDRLLRTRDVAPGQLVLLAGIGAGGATGATVLRV